jgi:pimeloyl-ACP methyl ester carboxylesterase
MRYFGRRYRCIAFNARGYPPSDVPKARNRYSQAIFTDDVAAILRHLKLRKAHIVGCSMDASTVLNFGIHHAKRALSLTAVGAGAGSDPARHAAYLRITEASARRYETLGMQAAHTGSAMPGRMSQRNKDPRGFAEFRRFEAEHSALGLANTLRGVQAKRPTVYQLGKLLHRMKIPLFVVSGDEDDNCVVPGVFIKQICPSARLWICPSTGHTVNTEEPAIFNQMLGEFLALIDSGRWRPRDPRSIVA